MHLEECMKKIKDILENEKLTKRKLAPNTFFLKSYNDETKVVT